MALTPAQLQTLKTAINADPALSVYPMNSDGYFDLANKLNNETSVPDFWVWRTSVSRADIYNTQDFAGLFWDWSTYKGQSVTEQGSWVQMFMGDQANFEATNFRAGLSNIFGAANAQTAHCFSVGRKKATRIEKIFGVASVAPPTPSGALGSPTAVATAQVHSVTPDDVSNARNLP
jgi:hypothetical protein